MSRVIKFRVWDNLYKKWIKDKRIWAEPEGDGICGENNPFYGKKHSEDTLKIISDKSKGRVSANRKAVVARNETETKEFPCLTLAAKSVNGFRELIWKAIKNNKQYKGYKWEYAN